MVNDKKLVRGRLKNILIDEEQAVFIELLISLFFSLRYKSFPQIWRDKTNELIYTLHKNKHPISISIFHRTCLLSWQSFKQDLQETDGYLRNPTRQSNSLKPWQESFKKRLQEIAINLFIACQRFEGYISNLLDVEKWTHGKKQLVEFRVTCLKC